MNFATNSKTSLIVREPLIKYVLTIELALILQMLPDFLQT